MVRAECARPPTGIIGTPDQGGVTPAPPPTPTNRRHRIEIQGAVQGVGFRPFVYRLATEESVVGWVVNDVRGVRIEVEAEPSVLERFTARLSAETPPLAMIESMRIVSIAPEGGTEFTIEASEGLGDKTTAMLPDAATCADCAAEVDDPDDRRFRYPFTNCTNCGPRFSIIAGLPYDRPNTTMRHFVMCDACRHEYEDPLDRRFHAQPNACPDCGPRLKLYERSEPPEWHASVSGHDALEAAAEALRRGLLVGVKGLGGFHLMADARNDHAVAVLRERKPRPHKPLAVMVRDLEQARTVVDVDEAAERLLTSVQAPIVLLPKRAGSEVVEGVAPGNPSLGVMLPYTPLHHLLLSAFGFPVVATSGNLTDEPIVTDEGHAFGYLGHIVDMFLVHDRPIQRHVDDSVAWVVDGRAQLLRRARGYAPTPVLLPATAPTILAVGAHLKNTVALTSGRRVFVSQHIGDLETAEAMEAFERVIADFLTMYEAEPDAVAHDLHPDYLSTKWAEAGAWPDRLIGVQHHHAHLASCLADNEATGPALGVTWDGTGYGEDGTIWGGEFLLGDASGYERAAHLHPFRLPGGDAALRHPARVALALLWQLHGEDALSLDLEPVRVLPPRDAELVGKMLATGANAPITTSAGRLFDGVAALLGLRHTVTFEAQAAMDLEYSVDPAVADGYPLPLQSVPAATAAPLVLDWRPMVAAIVEDLQSGAAPGVVAGRFHNSLVAGIVSVAREVGEPRVALTGGCFQNRILTTRTVAGLREAGFEVLLHRAVPPNDGGISLGQVAITTARLASNPAPQKA